MIATIRLQAKCIDFSLGFGSHPHAFSQGAGQTWLMGVALNVVDQLAERLTWRPGADFVVFDGLKCIEDRPAQPLMPIVFNVHRFTQISMILGDRLLLEASRRVGIDALDNRQFKRRDLRNSFIRT